MTRPAPWLGRAAAVAVALLSLGSATSCRAFLDLDDPPEGAAPGDAGGVDCDHATPITVSLGASPRSLKGSTLAGGSNQSAVGGTCNESLGPESVYAVTAEADGILTASLSSAGTSFNSVLYAASTCASGKLTDAIVCSDRTAPKGSKAGGGEVISLPVNAGDMLYFAIDGALDTDAGDYELLLSLTTGESCSTATPIVLEPGAPMLLVADSSKAKNDDSCTGTNAGSDIVYAITGVPGQDLQITAKPIDFDLTLFVRKSCADKATELVCKDLAGPGASESTVVPAADVDQNKTLYVWVDSAIALPGDGLAGGLFSLTLTPVAP